MNPRCDDCTLNGNRLYSVGSDTPLVAFVSDLPLNRKADQVLRSIFNYLGFTDYYICSLCMCETPERRPPSGDEIDCCFDRLLAELEEKDIHTVVALGSVAAKHMFGTGKSIKNDRGKFYSRSTYMGNITYHPTAVMLPQGDTLFPFLFGDIEKAINYATGDYISHDAGEGTQVFVSDTDEKMCDLIARLYTMDSTHIAFDWETTGLSPLWDTGFCFGISWKVGTAVIVPIDMIRAYAGRLSLALQKHKLVGYNSAGFDSLWNAKYGLPFKHAYDVQLIHYLLDERPQQRSLENLTAYYLNAPCYESEMMAKYKAKKATMTIDIPKDVIYEYCGKDVDWTLRLFHHLYPKLDESLVVLYRSLLHPAAETFAEIKQNGFWIDQEHLAKVKKDMEMELVLSLDKLKELTGRDDFNPRSHKQVQEYLWDTLGLEQPTIHKRQDRAADKTTLQALDHPFAHALSSYREYYTLYSRYIRDLHDYIEPDGRVRVSYHFDRTETGRLSTTNPAIHQTPRNSLVRTVYSAPPNHVLVQADYEQIEIRMAAHIARDEVLTKYLKSGADFHSAMAAEAFHIPIDQVTKEQRQAAKGVSFGLLYQMSNKGLIAQTGLPAREAIQFINRYKNDLTPNVQKWIEWVKEEIRTTQFISSPFGRLRRFPLITSENIEGLYREGVNFPIQSGASDITLHSAVKVHDALKKAYPTEAKLVAMVHDSLIVECHESVANDVANIMEQLMTEVPFETDVPFTVDVKIGKRWGD